MLENDKINPGLRGHTEILKWIFDDIKEYEIKYLFINTKSSGYHRDTNRTRELM